jgi:Flp pilus assembly protein TadD
MTVHCPLPRCGADNESDADVCASCGTPLRGYARLLTHAAALFNHGLAAAREGRLHSARDHFAAVVYWCPLDLEARNALALASYHLGDAGEARRQWEHVRRQRPEDPVASGGLAALVSSHPGASAGRAPA